MDHRTGHLAESLVGKTEHSDLGNGGIPVNRRLDLLARDILAAADDDVLLAIDDEEIAVLVEIADVARQEITVSGEGCGGLLGPVPIFPEIAHRADADFAAHALRDRAAIAAQDSEIDQRRGGAAGRIGLGEIIFAPVAAADAIGLGQAIAEQRRAAAHLLLDSLDMLDRARRAGGEIGDRRQIIF